MTFSGKLHHQAWMLAPETRKVMDALLENGGDARFVGGCVRNALSNRDVLDIDIATPLKPDEVIERLTGHKIGYAPTGLKHGTVTAIVDGHPFEITTLRLDVATDGRHADVAFTDSWKEDASRRDFTFNALYATIEGDIFDPFGGIEDLRRGLVRFVGDPVKRIEEDYLRILRFFRFHAHFGQEEPDPPALKACRAAAKQIAKLSGERIRQEVLKLLESGNGASTWQLMIDNEIVAHFLPEASNVPALERLVRLEKQQHEEHPFPLRRLAALLIVMPGLLSHVAKALKLSNEQTSQLALMTEVPVAAKMTAQEVRKLVYKHGNDAARNLLLLAAARTGEAEELASLYREATSFQPPDFPLQGNDILKTGVPPGPEVGKILKDIENWWISEDFRPDRAACLQRLTSATA